MNEQKKMTEMNEWLDEVCAALGVDRGLLAEVTPEVLELVVERLQGYVPQRHWRAALQGAEDLPG